MITVHARCTCGPNASFQRTTIQRRDPGPHDVLIDIAYAGICHSDIDHTRSTRGKSTYPLVPGHEIAGTVTAIGDQVTRFQPGDRVGVGNMVDSCRQCRNCLAGLEQYCQGKRVLAYNDVGYDGLQTYGGYSQKIVVDERFVVRIPDAIPLHSAAPLLCAGITLYSPLRHWKVGPNSRVAVVGLGGLGHIGVRMSKAFGAKTTVLELSPEKHSDAQRLGADDFRLTNDPLVFKELAGTFDLVISTVPVNVDMDAYLGLLDLDGTLVNLAVPAQPLTLSAATLLANRRSISGTRSGGIAETQEMLDFCADHNIQAEIELIHADDIDAAYRRLLAGDVKFRFVIDNATLAES